MIVSARVAGLFIGAPIFSRRSLPTRFRILLIFSISGLLGSAALPEKLPDTMDLVMHAMAGELLLGLAIGLVARFMIAAFQMAGTIMGRQMGFAMANGFDPEMQSQGTVIASLHTNLAAFLFLGIDGHHMLLRGLAASYQNFPIGGEIQGPLLAQTLMSSAGKIFEDGARVAAPVTGIMLLINVMLGFMNKINPQLSIFNVGLPLTVMVGMLAVMISIPDTTATILRVYEVLVSDVALLVGR